jgi:uncharacterized repeat protein (TIGR01451 family)
VFPCVGSAIAGGPAITAPAPSWTGADGVQVSGVGPFGRPTPTCPAVNPGDCRFFGTSAATPHGAACDALVRSAGAATTVAGVNARLAGTAVDRGPVGDDTAWGAGVLDCAAAAGLGADLVITKTDNVDPVLAGANVVYTVQVTNQGPANAQGVVVRDTIPAGEDFQNFGTTSANWDCSHVNGNVTCTWLLPTLPVGPADPIQVVVTTAIDCLGTIENYVNVTSDTPDPQPANNITQEETLCVVDTANLKITKTDTVDEVVAGNNLTYTITVENLGPDSAPSVKMIDTLAANAETVVSATGTGWSCSNSNGIVTCDLAGSLGVTTAPPITVVVTVDPDTRGPIVNNAYVTAAAFDPVEVNNFTEEDTMVVGEADLALTKGGSPAPVVAGTNLTYSISVTHNGPSTAENIAIVDNVPTNTVFVSASPSTGGSCSLPPVGGTGTVSCLWGGSTPVGGVRTLQMVVQVLSSTPAGTVVKNTATTTSDTTDPNLGNNSVTDNKPVITDADLSILKSDSPDPVAPGSLLTYTIDVSNAGPSDALNVVVTDVLPAGVAYVSDTDSCVEAPAGTLTCPLGTLVSGASTSFDITVEVDRGTTGVITNQATVTSDTPDNNTNNNTVTEDTTVNPGCSDLSQPGSLLVFPLIDNISGATIVTISNTGKSDALAKCYMVTRGPGGGIDEKQNFLLRLTPKENITWNTAGPYDLRDSRIPEFPQRQGYMFCWAIDDASTQLEIDYDFLVGKARVINLTSVSSFGYNAIPSQMILPLQDRILDLDSLEYTMGPSQIMFEGLAALPGSIAGRLAVANPGIDFVESIQPEFNINIACWDETEFEFSRHLHFKDFEHYDLTDDLRLNIGSIFTLGWHCTTNTSDHALWAVFHQDLAGIFGWGGNVYQHPDNCTPTQIILPIAPR